MKFFLLCILAFNSHILQAAEAFIIKKNQKIELKYNVSWNFSCLAVFCAESKHKIVFYGENTPNLILMNYTITILEKGAKIIQENNSLLQEESFQREGHTRYSRYVLWSGYLDWFTQYDVQIEFLNSTSDDEYLGKIDVISFYPK